MAVTSPADLTTPGLGLLTNRFWINLTLPDPYLSMPDIPEQLMSAEFDQLDHTRVPLYEQIAITKAEDELTHREIGE